ncbi:hypothetical protein GX48_02235 [Paracoccidioides brasiliensis]|nr:hypothetical protein GX48_02235 [Paracoccidioides brasiliensis]
MHSGASPRTEDPNTNHSKFVFQIVVGSNKLRGSMGATASSHHHCTEAEPPLAEDVTPHANPEELFNSYAADPNNHGWTGADSTFSVKLPDGRLLWLFSDTYLGPLNCDGTRPTSTRMINNCFVAQSGNTLTTITGGSETNRTAIMPPPAEGRWFWLGDGIISNMHHTEYLQVIFQEYQRTESEGPLAFKFVRNVVATFDLADLARPIKVDPLPSETGTSWGSAILPQAHSGDNHTYIYGVRGDALNKTMRIARFRGSDLSKNWEFLRRSSTPNDDGHCDVEWTHSESKGTDALEGIVNEFSVTPWNDGQFMVVSQDSSEIFSAKILMWSSCDPSGPFQKIDSPLYRMPESGPSGNYKNSNVVGYNAHVHPTLQEGDRWTLSYNVNSLDNRISPEGDNYRDPSIYRPRFVSFKLIPSKHGSGNENHIA